MSRGPGVSRQRVLQGALKAAAGAGVEVARIEIQRDGTIVIIPGKPRADKDGGGAEEA